MFKNDFQGGNFFEIINPALKDPLINCRLIGIHGIQKSFDNEVKGSIYQLDGTPSATKISLPKDGKQGLSLVQRVLVFQLNVKPNHDFSIEVGITDLSLNRRNLSFSTAHKELNVQPLSARIPMRSINRAQWTNFVLDLASLINDLWKNQTFKSIDFISISANCKLRKLFTLKNMPNIEFGLSSSEESLSQVDFPENTDSKTQLFTIDDLKSKESPEKMTDNNNWETTSSSKSKSQNVYKIAFGTKVAKVPSINSQKQQQQQQQTSLLKISNSQPHLNNQNDLLNNSLKNINISPLSISNGHLSNSAGNSATASSSSEAGRRKSFSSMNEKSNEQHQLHLSGSKTNWTQRATSSSSSTSKQLSGGGGGGGFLRLDQTHDLSTPSPYTAATAVAIGSSSSLNQSHGGQNNNGQTIFNHYLSSESQSQSTSRSTVDQTVPQQQSQQKIPRPPPQSTRPSGTRKIRLPAAIQQQHQQHQQQQQQQQQSMAESSSIAIKSSSSQMIAGKSTSTTAATAYESSNEDDVHNNSSKTIIDLIQPSRVKMNHLLNEAKCPPPLDKDSLNLDESTMSLTRNKLAPLNVDVNKQVKPVNHIMNEETSSSVLTDLIKERISQASVAAVSPPSPALLNSTSRNMNYDHRKYTNLGSVPRHNSSDNSGGAVASATVVEKKPTSPKHHNHNQQQHSHHHHQQHQTTALESTTDQVLMDSFEARMLQEMKAEMEAEKQLTNQRGSDARKNGGSSATTTTTSGVVGSTTNATNTTNTTSKSRKKAKENNNISSQHEEQTTTENDRIVAANEEFIDDFNSPDMARRGSSGIQSPWSDDQQTTSEKYNFDAMTSSIEDTTTSISKKAINRKTKTDEANNYQDEMNVSMLSNLPAAKSVNLKDLPLKYSPLSTQPQSQQNKIHQSPINEEPSQYDDSQADIDEIISDSDEEIDLLYDPSLNCYYDPKTGTYYELNLS